MHGPSFARRLVYSMMILAIFIGCLSTVSCGWLHPQPSADMPVAERPRVAILPIGIGVDITSLSTIKSVDTKLDPEEESRLVAEAVDQVRREARWLLQSRLATRQGFQFVRLDQTDEAAAELGLKPGTLPTAEQSVKLRDRLGADLLLVATIEDYGKVRWQWLLAGMLTDMTAESIIIGVATAWNPVAIFANVGFELLTSTPVWFGGGYLFGVAFRPVRVEARIIEPYQGYPVWQEMEIALYAWSALKQLPESERKKKESQLRINLETAMEALADLLGEQKFTLTHLRAYQQTMP